MDKRIKFNKNFLYLMLVFVFFALILSPIAIQAQEIEEDYLITTIFFYTDIREAFNEIMLQTGVNIIADDTVRGVVTLDLVQVPLDQALSMILLGGGYTYRKFDDYYLISIADPRSRNFHRIAETEAIRLEYITESEARNLLPSYYEQFLRSSSERDFITITATPEIISSFKEVLAKIDTPEAEVLIQIHVTEISTDVLRDRGGDLLGFLRDESDLPDDNYYRLLFDRADFSYLFKQDFGSLEGRLKFLAQTEDVSIEANPKILVNDRSTASLFIGEEQVVFLEGNEARARMERVNVGVELRVTPQVINDEIIRLNINPNFSHFSEERQDRLVVKRNELSTTVYAKNGETLNLAGMTLERETEFVSEVPILGNIPVLRWLFRKETEREAERELMIFLTAEIVGK